MQIKRILVPIDFSRSSLKAVDYAIDLAKRNHAELVLVHVIEPMNYALPRYLPEPTALLEEQRKEAQDALDRLVERVSKRHPQCRSEVHLGIVYERIADLARTLKADLVIIATHGRSGLAHLLIGSVAERVVRMAPCPVLTVRSPLHPAARVGKSGRASRSDEKGRK